MIAHPDYWKATSLLSESREDFVLVTLVSSRGAVPQDPGAKAIITREGLRWGTVGGGKVEARCIAHSRELLSRASSAPELMTWNLQRDIGMTCGGEATFLFETCRFESWRVAIFGAGHVGQALVRTLEPLSCQVVCADPRREWVERLPDQTKLRKLCLESPAELVSQLDSRTFFVVMTQGHATDVPVLTEIFKRHPDSAYIGAIGSSVKALKLKAELRERGISDSLLAKLRCPIGLPLGGNDPSEIAVSVVAEILQTRDRQSAVRNA